MSSLPDPSVQWPLHWAVWKNDLLLLKNELKKIPNPDREVSITHMLRFDTN